MKTKLKGFTLVELIVVMVIITILMAAVMTMFKPIRETYVDSTLNETQRTSQNGVIQYVTESIRFANDMGIYTKGSTYNRAIGKNYDGTSKASANWAKSISIGSAKDAVDALADAYIASNIYKIPAGKRNDVITAIEKYAQVIVIDNSDVTYNSKNCYGRIYRRKVDMNPATATAITSASESSFRLALGAAYYGENNYSIGIEIPLVDVTDGGVTVQKPDAGLVSVVVASTNNGKRDLSNIGNTTTLSAIKTEGGVTCRNLTAESSIGVGTAGVFDCYRYGLIRSEDNGNTTQKYPTSHPKSGQFYRSGSSSKGGKTYIVFLDQKGKEQVEKSY